MSVIISETQARVKNSAAYSDELGLMLIANGEEMPYLLTALGEKIPAGIPEPDAAPSRAIIGAGNLVDTKWYVWAFTYVSENSFPSVGARIYSNPSPLAAPFQITGGSNKEVQLTMDVSDNYLVTHLYVFRTEAADTELLAQTAADAGLLYYVGKTANTAGPTVTYTDSSITNLGNDPISYINFTVPQFRFVIWDGNYFWGFANHPFQAEASWDLTGIVTLQNPDEDKFYGGRDGQYITFDGISTGGIDGRGTFIFQQIDDSSGQVVDEDGANLTLPSTTFGTIVIIGESATLYRSAYRNPFAWGYLKNIAGEYIPSKWVLKIAGSLGTAIAIVPDQQILKLDMEFPALCVTFSLQAADTEAFEQTKRQISRLHSVTSHFSQFAAISKGRQVLWGMDFKTQSVLECDGYTQVPISGPISILLRKLSKNRSYHMVSHGIYDTQTEINAIWLPTIATDANEAEMMLDLCVYQHAPTGFWGVIADYGILASAPIEDPITSQRNILVGTEEGFLGKAFDTSSYGNWLPNNSIYTGLIEAATATSITRAQGQDDFLPTDAGLIGNFVIITNQNGLQSQIRKITAMTTDTIYFDVPLNPIPDTTDPGLYPALQWKFFIGLIELRVLKYMDEGTPSTDKAPREIWATLTDAEQPRADFYPEYVDDPTSSVELSQDTETDGWKNKFNFPTKKGKSFGIAIVERSYLPTKLRNFTIT